MKSALLSLFALSASLLPATAAVGIDEAALGASLGGWQKRSKQAAEYTLSGAAYRTYRPEISPTPDGGLFVSLRIDHVRGMFASDDHAVLEVTINSKGQIASAQSSIAIQGRSITSDVIRGGTDAGQKLSGTDRAVQIGTDLVADLSTKLLREKIVEAGRVSFPAALRHNYNLLFQSIRVTEAPPVAIPADVPEQEAAAPKPEPSPTPAPAKLEIKPYGGKPQANLPVPE
jgi:hypothetical protein